MIYIFSILLFALYLILPTDIQIGMGVSSDCIVNAMAYHFCHVSLPHVILNIVSLCALFGPAYNSYTRTFGYMRKYAFLILAYSGASLAGAIAAKHDPTIGASGIVFFLIGQYLMLNPNIKTLKSFIYTAIAVVLSIIFGKSNVALHITAASLGAISVILRMMYDKTRV